MTGILILAHGSRKKETEEVLASVVNKVRAAVKTDLLESAFMQFSEKDLSRGLGNLVEQGATEIKVIPYFLFNGVHIEEDIPAELEKFRANHTNIEVTLESTLGDDDRLAAILVDKIKAVC